MTGGMAGLNIGGSEQKQHAMEQKKQEQPSIKREAEEKKGSPEEAVENKAEEPKITAKFVDKGKNTPTKDSVRGVRERAKSSSSESD